ncbi:MAG TPA: helix-turn-helix domain-containing protein, partial [Caulobacteraceae bacterium]|nr:helix-turn-helix domain-containing protein [Caulobacteraceae bacterium]
AHLRTIKPESRPSGSDDFGARLRRRRERLGLSIEKSAALLGVRRWTWGLWENGRQVPSALHRRALEERLLSDIP